MLLRRTVAYDALLFATAYVFVAVATYVSAGNFDTNEYLALGCLFALFAILFAALRWAARRPTTGPPITLARVGDNTVVVRPCPRARLADPGHVLWSALLPVAVFAIMLFTGADISDGSEMWTLAWIVVGLVNFQGGRIWQRSRYPSQESRAYRTFAFSFLRAIGPDLVLFVGFYGLVVASVGLTASGLDADAVFAFAALSGIYLILFAFRAASIGRHLKRPPISDARIDGDHVILRSPPAAGVAHPAHGLWVVVLPATMVFTTSVTGSYLTGGSLGTAAGLIALGVGACQVGRMGEQSRLGRLPLFAAAEPPLSIHQHVELFRQRLDEADHLTFWDFVGLRAVWDRLSPPAASSRRPPSTLFLWCIGLYVALFGIASNRYENEADRVELRANAAVTLLASSVEEARASGVIQAAAVRQSKVPRKPEFLIVPTTFLSLMPGIGEPYPAAVRTVNTAVDSMKESLSGLSFVRADLSDAYFSSVNLSHTDFTEADLTSADLTGADLTGADLRGVRLRWSRLRSATLTNVDFTDAFLYGADLSDTDLTGANLTNADLTWVNMASVAWEGIALIRGATLRRVRNAPPALLEWAKENGAILE